MQTPNGSQSLNLFGRQKMFKGWAEAGLNEWTPLPNKMIYQWTRYVVVKMMPMIWYLMHMDVAHGGVVGASPAGQPPPHATSNTWPRASTNTKHD